MSCMGWGLGQFSSTTGVLPPVLPPFLVGEVLCLVFAPVDGSDRCFIFLATDKCLLLVDCFTLSHLCWGYLKGEISM